MTPGSERFVRDARGFVVGAIRCTLVDDYTATWAGPAAVVRGGPFETERAAETWVLEQQAKGAA